MNENNNKIFPKWFNDLSTIGEELASLHDKNFVFCVCLPTLEYSCPALLLGLIKKYIQILNSYNPVEMTLENISSGTLIKIHQFDNKIYKAIFLGIENIMGEKCAKLHIKSKNQSLTQYIPINKTISRVLIPNAKRGKHLDSLFTSSRTEREDSFDLNKEIKNTYRGFEKIYLTPTEANELKLSHTSKIHIIAEKKSTKVELTDFDICQINPETQMHDPYKKLGVFNDILRVKNFVNDGESFFSTISSPLTPQNYEISKDIKFKIYMGSNSFTKLHEDEDEQANSIIILSPKENNFENSIFALQKRFTERKHIDIEKFEALKNLNLNFPAMIFKER